jgi:hypothetical protein
MGTPEIGKKSLFRKGHPSRIKFSDSRHSVKSHQSAMVWADDKSGPFTGPLRVGGQSKIHGLRTLATQVRLILQCDGHASLGDHPRALYTELYSIGGSVPSRGIFLGDFE